MNNRYRISAACRERIARAVCTYEGPLSYEDLLGILAAEGVYKPSGAIRALVVEWGAEEKSTYAPRAIVAAGIACAQEAAELRKVLRGYNQGTKAMEYEISTRWGEE